MNSAKAIKKTRKPHTCDGCCCKIPIGSAAYSIFGVKDGDVYSGYLCVPCDAIFERHYREFDPYDEGWAIGDILTGAKEAGFDSVADWVEQLDKVKEVKS